LLLAQPADKELQPFPRCHRTTVTADAKPRPPARAWNR
jgi:hypothetical protein